MNSSSTQAGASGLDTAASDSAVDRAFGDNAIDALLAEVAAQDDTETVEDEAEATEEQEASEESEETSEDTSEQAEADTSKNGKSAKASDTAREKGIGWDKVLKILDNTDPLAAKEARRFQGEWSKIHGQEAEVGRRMEDAKSLQNQLRDALEEVKGLRGQDVEEQRTVPTLEELLPNVPVAQREAFKAAFEVLKDQMGLVSRDELQYGADKKAQSDYIKTLYTDHAKKHGDQFGTVNGKGELILSPEMKPKMEAVRDRLSSGRQGVTWADLHILASHEDIVKAERLKAVADYRESLKARTSTKVAALKRGQTVDGSTSTGGTKFARGKGESAKATYARAFDLAWNNSVTAR